MAPCRVTDIEGLTGREVLAGTWLLGLAVAAALWLALRGRTPRVGGIAWRAAGIGLMSVPAWEIVLRTLPEMAKTFCAGGDVAAGLPAAAAPQVAYGLSGHYIGALLDLAYVAIGYLVWLQGARPGWWRAPSLRGVAAGVTHLLPMGRGEMPSLRLGIALFPLLAAANLLLSWATGLQGRYYEDVGWYHATILAFAAGVGEEVVYRGVMQQGLRRLLQGSGPRRALPTGLAIVLQAIPFAYAHAAYGDATLLLFAFLFALVAGVVVELWGIWCAIALHVLIDLYGFALGTRDSPALAWIALACAPAILWVSAATAWQGLQGLRLRAVR